MDIPPNSETNGFTNRNSHACQPPSTEPGDEDPIAIIGFSLRFPQDATYPQKFWDLLQGARTTRTEVPADRFNIDGFYHPDASRNDTINTRGGHFLTDDVAAFDAPFFSMNPSEAESMDPQQRGLLETTYQALENAGVPIEKAAGSNTSVYVGALGAEYSRLFEADEEVHATYKATGNSGAMLSNRLSWFYDLRGPSMTIETACSSSLIGLHLACQSLRSGDSRMSLVGGAQLYLEPLTSAISLSSLQFMSPSGRCQSFDASGDGYGKGEGFVVVVLKRLSDALEDGDVIRAVVRATATNQDGRTPGISQPSQSAQERLIREAYRSGGLELSETRLFEAHGTGTVLGDTVEAGAIGAVFGQHRSPTEPMYIGAAKANVGHLEAAAGLAGVVKTVLCLEKGIIPPIAGLQELNPRIRAQEWNLGFPTAPLPWPTDGLRRASVNAFGYGGSNAHAVLDDAYNYLRERGLQGHHITAERPPVLGEATANGERMYITNGTEKQSRLLVWSVADSSGIDRIRAGYEEYMRRICSDDGASTEYLRDLAYTLSTRRSRLPWRSFAVATSLEDLAEKITNLPKAVRSSSTSPKVQFIFTGQGAQWARMGVELLRYNIFHSSLQAADLHLKRLGSTWSLLEELQKSEESTQIDSPALAQPLCTALQVALVELFRSWGITPSGVLGHSSGEIAAAFCAGAISRESAWTIAYYRGALAAKLAATTPPTERGTMMVVGLSQSELRPYLKEIRELHGESALAVGCTNSAKNITITGLERSIDILKSRLDDEAVFARKLPIPVAYHSSHMQAIADEYQQCLEGISPPSNGEVIESPSRPIFVSSVTGEPLHIQQLSQPEYWVKNLVSEVRFADAITKLDDASTTGDHHYVEIGPHAALQRAVKDNITRDDLKYDSAMHRGVSAVTSLQQLAGKLWAGGVTVNIDAVNGPDSAQPAKLLVNLPEYPFNHSKTYWLESRMFKNYRQRGNIRHELVGIPTTDWNPLEPKYRFTIRVSDLPWVTDHRLNGSPVYPAAGMLIMAIEAARYLARPGRTVKGYRLRSVRIFAAIVIPETPEGVESQVSLRNAENSRTTGIQSIEGREFRVAVYSDNEWREVCAGSILIEYDEDADEVYAGDEQALTRNYYQSLYAEAVPRCSATSTRDIFYTAGHEIGYGFGPLFNTLHDLRYEPDGDHALAVVSPDEWRAKVPEKSARVQPHIIHPTALDAVFQVTAVATTKGGTIIGPLQAPTQLTDFWISHDLLSRTADTRLQVLAKTTLQAARETDSFIMALNSSTGEPAIIIDGYRVTTVSSLQYTPSPKRTIFYRLDWKPDVDLLTRNQTEQYCIQKETMPKTWQPSKMVVALYYMSEMLKEIDTLGFQCTTHHLQKYVDWVRYHFQHLGTNNPLFASPWREIFADDTRRTEYLEEFAACGPVERALLGFCLRLLGVVKQETDPLDLLFNHGIARDLYLDAIFTVTARRMATFMDLVAHKNPGLDILEVGAGTGSGTGHVLAALAPPTGPRYSSYTFTDISPGFFESARTQFADHQDRMNFQILDIERDPTGQGFEAGKYDVIIAAAVLHATKCVKDTLRHVRSLLKPGGYLVLVEPTNKQDTVLNVVWGTLPGWWRSIEKDRFWSPLYSEQEWDLYLREMGFTGVETAIPDFPELEQHTLTFLVSRAAPDDVEMQRVPESVVIAAETEMQLEVAKEIARGLTEKGCARCEIVPPDTALGAEYHASVCVSLLDLGQSFLDGMGESEFAVFKRVMGWSQQVYWITSGAGDAASMPENGLSSGFSRALMLEHPGFHMASVDIDAISTASNTIISLLERSFSVSAIDDREGDYSESHGLISIPRVVTAPDINDYVHTQTGTLEVETTLVGEHPTEPLEVQFTPGQLDSFRFVRDQSPSQPLAADEVEVQVKAAGINFADVMCALGQITDSYIGHEYTGIIRRVGSSVTGFAPGDRVCGMASGTFKTFVRNKVHTTIAIPDDLPFTHAFPAVWLTALYGLTHLASLRRGESILIHSAAGAVGQTAIQLAQHIGADVFVTVGSPAKKKLLQEFYGIPDDRFFSSRRLSFGRQIMRATHGRGVDVILNSVSGEALAETWRCIAPLGRFIEIGKRDIYSFQSLPMYPFSKNVSFSSLDLQTVYKNHPALIGQLMQELKELLFSRALGPPQPVTQFSRGEFEQAFRYLQTGRHMGKAVVNWETEAEITVIPCPGPEYTFDPHASYVIAGGLGGIGRSLARWFSTRGARHLILLSRSGAVSTEAVELVRELAQRGVQVATPRCDVSQRDSLKAALNECSTMPPIKGVIQASMVLQDRLFTNMTLDEWQSVLNPKVQGTWNLHHQLPSNLDFFVILSSLGGMIGSRGQSQYNAASTFQDAFARYRHSQGQKCISIDVGLVTSVGYVAEQETIAKRWVSSGFEILRETELHAVVDWACHPARTVASSRETQVLTAVDRPVSLTQQGKEFLPYMARTMYRPLHQLDRGVTAVSSMSATQVDYGALLAGAKDVAEAASMIGSALSLRLSQALSIPEEDVDVARPAHSYGVDSLVAVELRFWFAQQMKVDLSVFSILANVSMKELAVQAARKSEYCAFRSA